MHGACWEQRVSHQFKWSTGRCNTCDCVIKGMKPNLGDTSGVEFSPPGAQRQAPDAGADNTHQADSAGHATNQTGTDDERAVAESILTEHIYKRENADYLSNDIKVAEESLKCGEIYKQATADDLTTIRRVELMSLNTADEARSSSKRKQREDTEEDGMRTGLWESMMQANAQDANAAVALGMMDTALRAQMHKYREEGKSPVRSGAEACEAAGGAAGTTSPPRVVGRALPRASVGDKRKLSQAKRDVHHQIMLLEAADEQRRAGFHLKEMSADDYLDMKADAEDEYEQQQIGERRKRQADRNGFEREYRALEEEIGAFDRETAAADALHHDLNQTEREQLAVETEIKERKEALQHFQDDLNQAAVRDGIMTEEWSPANCKAAGYSPKPEEHLVLWRGAGTAANALEVPDPHNESRQYD